jgi:hypothetical protein
MQQLPNKYFFTIVAFMAVLLTVIIWAILPLTYWQKSIGFFVIVGIPVAVVIWVILGSIPYIVQDTRRKNRERAQLPRRNVQEIPAQKTIPQATQKPLRPLRHHHNRKASQAAAQPTQKP